jgi:hypothetical protein
MARAAKIARARGLHAVTAEKVAFVDDVRFRQRELLPKVLVAGVAVPDSELVLVLMAAEAAGHGRFEGRSLRFDAAVAAHAGPWHLFEMLVVPEPNVTPVCQRSPVSRLVAVAGEARPFVVRVLVARGAALRGR